MSDPYDQYSSLGFERPADGVLKIILSGPGLNSVSRDVHRELAEVWLTVDRDPRTRVALIVGEGRAFSADDLKRPALEDLGKVVREHHRSARFQLHALQDSFRSGLVE